MKIVFAGGGTAGHIEPALASARQWIAENPESQLLFLGTPEGLETQLVPAAGFELALISKVRIPRKISSQLFKVPASLLKSFSQCRAILQGADLLIGFGGYVSGPAYIAAKFSGVPIVIHEANAKPGLANRLGALFTQYLAVAQPIESGPFTKALITGLPLRKDIEHALLASAGNWNKARSSAKRSLGFNEKLPLVLVTGGSQGSVAINKCIADSLEVFATKQIQIFHSVGGRNDLPTSTELYKSTAYISDMATAYLAADLIISRSGAVTCSEVGALGKYALFIPLPIGNGEQEVNTRSLVEAGRAEVISQKSFSREWLTANIDRLLAKSAARPAEGFDSDVHAAKKIVALMQRAISGEQI